MSPSTDPANVVQTLVYSLLDVFDATRDLYKTLRIKEKKDHEELRRLKGYARSRRGSVPDIDDEGGDEAIVLDKAAVVREFEIGNDEVGPQYAVGDVLTQTALQSQIISLQSALITTFLYGPSSPEPISHHLATIQAASRTAGTSSVDALLAQRQRMMSAMPPPRPRSQAARKSNPLPYPVTNPSASATETVITRANTARRPSNPPPTEHSTALVTRPKANRTDTESTAFSGPTSYGTSSTPHTLFCLYALDLQRHPKQSLSSTITSSAEPYCPYCNRALNLSPGKSWEIFKDDNGHERCFRIQNRFVVKCHRDGVDGAYSCVLCSQSGQHETICGDVKALVRHVWMDHEPRELEHEDDIVEKVERVVERRRDSGIGAGSRVRSMSLGPARRSRGYEREVDTFEIRPPRHGPRSKSRHEGSAFG